MIKVDGCDDDYDYNDEGDCRCDMAGALDYEPHAIAPDPQTTRLIGEATAGASGRCSLKLEPHIAYFPIPTARLLFDMENVL